MVYRAEVTAEDTDGVIDIYFSEADDIRTAVDKVLDQARSEWSDDVDVKVSKIERVPDSLGPWRHLGQDLESLG